MAADRAYLDHNASAPLLEAARAAMLAALESDGNPSSVHAEGRAARRLVETARRQVAALVGGKADDVVFTSGATEAAATLLTPGWRMGRGPLSVSRLFVTAAEHPCILCGGRFPADSVTVLPVDRNGLVDLTALEAALSAHDPDAGMAMLAIHAANNETGVIQPMAQIGRIARAARALVVVDAVQAAGRIPLDISDGSADFLILSSHKIGGPKGAGAIVGASDLLMPLALVPGGGQEKGHRSGTENVAAIAGFGAAAGEALAGLADMAAVQVVRDRIEAEVRATAPDATIFGEGAPRLPNTTFFDLPGVKAETAQIAFDLAGVALSAGSACSSGRVGPSQVLKAMGHGDQASALRVSIGRSTGDREVSMFTQALRALVSRQARAATRAA
ncbi:cysteine desulfurase family protein [Aquibium sp. ELW1220]|uniref:cysteine desulfurase family protein n=1 Tax=Aquibium sp. ELW1220 TaxID=2976766 RepID=UPI0025B1C205|nr:cysteine desulfurase family protein [Aquibium sp. ELW1220]MDN2579209.1 cysteine desulfurase [Aquibium sp. ELW1220]